MNTEPCSFPDASPPKPLTIQSLREAMQDFEMAQMDSELSILLSDNGPAALSLLHGDELIQVNQQWFVVNTSAMRDHRFLADG